MEMTKMKRMKMKKILISNRGEIAIRVVRACRELGIKSVAIYSDEDSQAMHVRLADEAYHVGPPSPAESYLNIPKIIETAKRAAADAVHPGYGFLSENASFAEACEKAGLIFIGPGSKTLQLTGDKMKCKAVSRKAGVSVVPGSDETIEDVEKAADIAHEIGYPVLLKSAFGGGGRGIRHAGSEEQLREEFEMASMEAKTAFGRSAIYVEKFLPRIRHIEFQLMRDSHANVVHLFERECSIQRRHQKLIELSPSPVVDSQTRNRIGSMAVKAANAVEYLNAGTAEFLRADDGNFYFIEINSRLQVEHPVTELVTGLDLVKLQLHIAGGGEIPFKQGDLKLNGSAIECRINAEDPLNDFAPSSGLIPHCTMPYGPGIRVDTYLYPGCSVSGYYDSLVAKLLAWGSDFEEARRRVRNALNEFYIEGVGTTIPLYRTIIDDPAFIAGDLSTDFLERFQIFEKMESVAKADMKKNADAIVAAALLHSVLVKRGRTPEEGTDRQSGRWKNAGMFGRSFGHGI